MNVFKNIYDTFTDISVVELSCQAFFLKPVFLIFKNQETELKRLEFIIKID